MRRALSKLDCVGSHLLCGFVGKPPRLRGYSRIATQILLRREKSLFWPDPAASDTRVACRNGLEIGASGGAFCKPQAESD